MIAHLRGKLAQKDPARVIVDVNGVGYEVFVPLTTFTALPDTVPDPHAGCTSRGSLSGHRQSPRPRILKRLCIATAAYHATHAELDHSPRLCSASWSFR